MKILMLVFSIQVAFAQISVKEDKQQEVTVVKKKLEQRKLKSTDGNLALLKRIQEQNAELLKRIGIPDEKFLVWDGTLKIETGKIIKGLLLNSVVSTNLESPLMVQVYSGYGLPDGTKFMCKGVTKNKRVLTVCDRMITPIKEVSVKVQILNPDGTSGLRGEYNDGKDSYIAGAVVSEFAKGVLSASKGTFQTPLGAINEVNDKNKILEGLANSAQTTTDVLLDEYKNQEPKVFIEAGKEVLIFFMEGMNAY
ncbi:MAG: TrbI/VirB10 family protein [Bacteriovorax sp.]|nr:TrbI/VirB10 family protein [Bacteriovorax sp.]